MAAFEILGRPDPLLNGESDRHSFAFLKFVLSNKYISFYDPMLTSGIYALRVSFILNLASFALLIVLLINSEDARRAITLGCLLGR